MLSAHCRSCGSALGDAAERKLGRHLSCPGTYDEATLSSLKDWRAQAAQAQSLPAYCIFTDATLMAIAEARPTTPEELLRIHGLGQTKGRMYGPQVLAVLAENRPTTDRPAEVRGSRNR